MADIPSKSERLREFFRRLGPAPVADTFDVAYAQICDTLNAVEDELTGIPFDPSRWMTDGRMYPPQLDNMTTIPGRPGIRRFRSLAHVTWVGDNGAIEIRTLSAKILFSKPGADGRGI